MDRSILLGQSLIHRSAGNRRSAYHLLNAGLAVVCLLVLLGAGSLLPAEVPAIAFVSRSLPSVPDPVRRQAAIERAAWGRLLVREPSGQVRVLVDGAAGVPVAGAPTDVMNPEVSFDGSRIVFAGYSAKDEGFRIFEIDVAGTNLQQITHSDRRIDLTRYGAAAELFRTYDDVDPCYLPGRRICFVSTRYPGVAPDGRVRTTNLYVANDDGSDVHRITTERFGADTPTVEPSTGRIVYSRWWRTAQAAIDPKLPPPEPIPPGSPGYGDIVINASDLVLRGVDDEAFPGVNSWFLSGIDPDGTDLSMYSGFRLDRGLTQAHRPSFLPSGEVLALFIPRTPYLGYPRGDGLRRFRKGPGQPVALGGPQDFGTQDNTKPAGIPGAPPSFFYASAEPLPDGPILVSGARASSTSLDYGIYLHQNSVDDPSLLFDQPGTAELDAIPLVGRPTPPVIAETALDRLAEEAPRTAAEAGAEGGSFIFRCENVHFNGPVNMAIANAPPIGRKLAIEFYLAPQRESTSPTDPPILIRKIDLPPNGKVETEIPAGVPLFEALRRPDGKLALGRDGQIFHVGGMNFGRAGETNRCVGCHAGHSQLAVPDDPSWTNVAPSAAVRASSVRLNLKDPAGNGTGLGFFEAFRVVDRRTDALLSEWAAAVEPVSTLDLVWSTRIRGREVVVYGTVPGAGFFGVRNQVIQGLSVTTFLDKVPVQSVVTNGAIQVSGTSVALDPGVEFNSLRVTIHANQVTGLYEGEKGAALAEVEVVAQVAGDPRTLFLRGDSDCNSQIDIVDAILILSHLFLGNKAPCCQAGADANDDSEVDVSDPIMLLDFMFIGGSPLPPPFPGCGAATNENLTCDLEACF